MKVYLGTDHAGYELKESVKEFLEKEGYTVEDCGADAFDKDDDYPDFIYPAAQGVGEDPQNNKAIIFGKSGQGEAMVANKVKGVRAVVYYGGNKEIIELSRDHNNANVLSIGAGFVSKEEACELVKSWLSREFTGEERHARRINKISEIENKW